MLQPLLFWQGDTTSLLPWSMREHHLFTYWVYIACLVDNHWIHSEKWAVTTFEEVLGPRPESCLIPILGKFWSGAWLAFLLVHCLLYIPFSTEMHVKSGPSCQTKWSSSLLLIIISFLLCLIVASLPSTPVGFPDPGMLSSQEEDNTEKT